MKINPLLFDTPLIDIINDLDLPKQRVIHLLCNDHIDYINGGYEIRTLRGPNVYIVIDEETE